ncbi:YdcF family protein [Caproicibacter sp.]|uniref:YdcF family protein n=1 Tax=Caproicibacter sp. TaxID=2814884 RepID=UPI00398A3588
MGKFRRAALWVLGILSALGLVWFIGPIHWNVLNIGNISGIAVCLLILACVLLSGRINALCGKNRAVKKLKTAVLVLFCAGLLWAAVLTGLMVSGATSAPPETATVLVLGSKVSGNVPSADLRERIEAAANYLNAHPAAVCVACGGQGRGENRTEAEVIRQGLVSRGVDASRVFLEDRSTSTQENISNAQKIIGQNALNRGLAIVTDEYHEYRACSIARGLGASAWAVPAHTPWYIFSACWARELLALSAYLLLP